MAEGTCACGCGQATPIAKRNRHDLGHIKGEHVPYCRGHNRATGVGVGESKACPRCDRVLPAVDFFAGRAGRPSGACKDCLRAYHRALRASKPQRQRVLTPEQRADAVERTREWRRANVARTRTLRITDAHRRRGAAFTDDARLLVSTLRADPCAYCGEPGGTIDHIAPVVLGGDGEWDNLTGACLGCNSAKRDRPLLSFLACRPA